MSDDLKREVVRELVTELGAGERVDVVTRLVDYDAITVTETGDVVGVAEAVGRVRDEAPEFFEKPTRPTSSIATGSSKTSDRRAVGRRTPKPTDFEKGREAAQAVRRRRQVKL